MKKLQILYIIVVLGVLACSNDKRQTKSIVSDVQLNVEQSAPDTTSSVQEEVPKTDTPVSSSSSSSHLSDSYDNMRGFDPASEDDMDDNGMSRYMENNDEEGWD